MQIEDTLAYLTGRWAIERRLVDHRADRCGRLDGIAEISLTEQAARPIPATGAGSRRARYEERGRLRLGSVCMRAGRELAILDTDAGAVVLRFMDGREFITLDLRPGAWEAVHGCAADRYELRFEVRSPGTLVEDWRVRGSVKDYEARTVWRRLGGHSDASARR
ncbi:MAG TPA: DUF6314 family protein [Solirubrobacteraceae bacterium]|nr:DUF6314 family protein [Solirubrobacteraceae bacterium]